MFHVLLQSCQHLEQVAQARSEVFKALLATQDLAWVLSRLGFGHKDGGTLLQHAFTFGVHIDAGGVQADVAEDAFEDV